MAIENRDWKNWTKKMSALAADEAAVQQLLDEAVRPLAANPALPCPPINHTFSQGGPTFP